MNLFSCLNNTQRALMAFMLASASLCCYLNAPEIGIAAGLQAVLGAGFFISIIFAGRANRQTP